MGDPEEQALVGEQRHDLSDQQDLWKHR